MGSSKGIAAHPDQVVLSRFAIVQDLLECSGDNEIVVAEEPHILAAGLLKAL